MTKNAVLLPLLLFAGLVQSAHAQTFKVGDYVETRFGTTWIPCKVSGPLSGGTYVVSCGADDSRVQANPQEIRARAATSEDKRIEAETAAALARQPRGNTVGAKYGTREPTVCANRTAPTRGAPSAEQARQYFICDQEQESAPGLSLVTNVKVQVASVSHPPNQTIQEIHASDLDARQPIWDIRGSFTLTQCQRLSSLAGWPASVNDFARTHNCNANDMPAATGYCYKNTFGEWHCVMLDVAHMNANTRQHVLPPAGN